MPQRPWGNFVCRSRRFPHEFFPVLPALCGAGLHGCPRRKLGLRPVFPAGSDPAPEQDQRSDPQHHRRQQRHLPADGQHRSQARVQAVNAHPVHQHSCRRRIGSYHDQKNQKYPFDDLFHQMVPFRLSVMALKQGDALP